MIVLIQVTVNKMISWLFYLLLTTIITSVIGDCNKCLQEGVSLIYGVDKQCNTLTETMYGCSDSVNCTRAICAVSKMPDVYHVVVDNYYPC
jgi:hypothetical protein